VVLEGKVNSKSEKIFFNDLFVISLHRVCRISCTIQLYVRIEV